MALKDYHVIEDLVPSGGWRYMQMWNGEPIRIPVTGSAKSAEDLLRQVLEFRVMQNIEIEDLEQDVAEYIKKVSVQNDRFKGRNIGKPRIRAKRPIIYDIRDWVDKSLEERPRIVTIHEAMERAAICAKCPQNIEWKTKCGSCNDEVEYRSRALRKIPSSKYDDAMKACRLHLVHLVSAIFLDQDHLPGKSSGAPEHCWMPKK